MEPPGWHLPCVIGRDLRFSFLSLENVYVREHNVRACSTDLRMMVFRAPLWLVIGAKLWRGGEYGEALAIMLLGETCLLVYAAMRLDYERFVRRYRSVLLLGVVLVQAILAHWRTDLVWPEKDGEPPSLRQQAIVLGMGNGVFFLYLTLFMSRHLWPWLLAQQSVVLLLDVLANGRMCRMSTALQAGYLHLHSRLPTKLSNFAMDCVMSRVLHAHGLAPPPASAGGRPAVPRLPAAVPADARLHAAAAVGFQA